MAAHALTALKEIQLTLDICNDVNAYLEVLDYALDHAAWADQLGDLSWQRMKHLLSKKDLPGLKAFLKEKVVALTEEWERLGRPRTWEDWMEAQFPKITSPVP